ncbi:MAG TPA: GntR family transcriptional regulator [Steroidobacteraceae bacterium]|nr:GntR family transcriptional regulator [Steroidobacteraceae bacterium]
MSRQMAEAVVRLREMVLNGKLAPGQRVAEAPLADLLGMSRTPVRQALPVLAQEGLLVENETRGYLVRAFTATEITDAIDVRGALEALAAQRVVERGVSRSLARDLHRCLDDGDALLARRRLEDGDEVSYAEMNARFHALILHAADSAILSSAFERIARVPFAGPQALAFDRLRLDQMYDRLHYAHRQHHAIVGALESGQAGRVDALMREHAHGVKESLNLVSVHAAAADAVVRVAFTH